MDNNDDGVPDDRIEDWCGISPDLPLDPWGQAEEDAYLHPANGSVFGKTEWTANGVDMICTGITLELASKKGLRGKQVKAESVLDVASYWTNASDGEPANDPQHPQDSTQIRFRIKDDDWGEPRPRGCYDWVETSSRWVCRVANPDCSCVPVLVGGVGMAN